MLMRTVYIEPVIKMWDEQDYDKRLGWGYSKGPTSEVYQVLYRFTCSIFDPTYYYEIYLDEPLLTIDDIDELARGLYDIIKSHHDIILDKTYEEVREEVQSTYDHYLEYQWTTYGQLIMREKTHRIKGGTLK